MQLRLTVAITEPNTGMTQVVTHLFDTQTANQAKWDGLFPEVQAAAAAIVAQAQIPTTL